MPGSTSARYLETRGLGFARLDGPRAAERDVLAVAFEPQEYAALPRGSVLREPLDVAILEVTRALSWEDTLQSYFGG